MKKPIVHFKKQGMICSRCLMKGFDADLHTNCTKPFDIGTPLCEDCPLQGVLEKNAISILHSVKQNFKEMYSETLKTISVLEVKFNEFIKDYEN